MMAVFSQLAGREGGYITWVAEKLTLNVEGMSVGSLV